MGQSDDFIEVAVARAYISKPQADLLREELFMFPGGNILSMMLRRGMITPEQARELESGDAPSEDEADEIDEDFGGSQIAHPTPQPSSPELKRPSLPQAQNSSAQTGRQSGISAAIAAATLAASSAPAPGPSSNSRLPATNFTATAATTVRPAIAPGISSNISPDPLMVHYLKAGRERGCSDLHITIGKPPYFRQHGKIFFMDEPVVTEAIARKLCLSVLTPEQKRELEEDLQLDFSFGFHTAGRFRANVYRQRLGYEGAFRFIPNEVPTLESLKLPKVLEKLTTYTQGLNLVTGPGGCGKTSTVAAMLEHINRHRHEHIITVEDPIEYVFHPESCQITQREVGTHTESFANALRTALRQDPDVIMIGELRDLETTSISITAAETGHLVFGTLHTSSAIRTVARILDVYPPAQRAQICLMVAESLRGVLSQQLIDRKDGKGRACAMEVLLVTTGVSQVIKEGKTHQLVSHMQSGRKLGMISMDDSLMELLQAGIISGREAYSRAENKSAFEMVRNQV